MNEHILHALTVVFALLACIPLVVLGILKLLWNLFQVPAVTPELLKSISYDDMPEAIKQHMARINDKNKKEDKEKSEPKK
jgi:hypothetical protein